MEGGTILSMRNRVGRRHILSAGGMALQKCSPCSPFLYRFRFQCLDSNRLNSPSGRNPRTMDAPSYKSATALDQLSAPLQRLYRYQSVRGRCPLAFGRSGVQIDGRVDASVWDTDSVAHCGDEADHRAIAS